MTKERTYESKDKTAAVTLYQRLGYISIRIDGPVKAGIESETADVSIKYPDAAYVTLYAPSNLRDLCEVLNAAAEELEASE